MNTTYQPNFSSTNNADVPSAPPEAHQIAGVDDTTTPNAIDNAAMIEQEDTKEIAEPCLLNAYEARVKAKRERYEEKASQAKNESVATYNRAHKMAEAIPFGQPILVDHYSANRDRNYRGKIHNTFGKAFALQDKAEYYAQKAESVGTGGISSDDPEAIEKLRAQLAALELAQERMKAANKAIRRHKTPDSRLTAVIALGFSEVQAMEVVRGNCMGCIGFPRYALSNNNSNVSRIKKRIAQLEKLQQRADVVIECEGFTYREDTEENRVMFVFECKPEVVTREILKKHAFKWSPSRGAWVRQLSNRGIWAGKEVLKCLSAREMDDE